MKNFKIKKIAMLLSFLALITACAAVSSKGTIKTINDAGYPLNNAAHKEAGMVCSDCHKEADKADYSSQMSKSCFDCHGSSDELAKSTEYLGETYNIHDSAHWGKDMDCSTCHRAHKPTQNMCLQCHEQDKMKALVVK